MPNWADGQHKTHLGVDAAQVSMRFGQRVDDFFGREQLPHEQVGRLLVAVAHKLAGFAQAVGPGRAQREQHHVGLLHKLARVAYQLLNGLQQFHRRIGPDAAVQVVALPAAAGFHKMLLPVHFFARRRAQQLGQRQRLKHGAKRVYQRVHLVGHQPRTHAIGEAGAHGQDPGRARQLVRFGG